MTKSKPFQCETTMAIFLTDWTNQSKPTIANLFYFYVFTTIWMKFGMWTVNAPALLLLLHCSCTVPGLLLACFQPAPGLLMVFSCPAPDPAHPSFAAFIISSTLRLFLARREPPFMVNQKVTTSYSHLFSQEIIILWVKW